MNNVQAWVEAAKKLSVFHEAKVECPECSWKHLTVFDVPLADDCSTFERVLFCRSCKAGNSMRMNGAERFSGIPDNLTVEEKALVKEINSAYDFSEKAIDKL